MPISTGLNSDQIRVGIILHEDQQSDVILRWPSGGLAGCSVPLQTGATSLAVRARGDRVEFESASGVQRVEILELWTLGSVMDLKAGDGIHVDSVRTGRGFHWEKEIAVTLPGMLTVSAKNGALEMVNHVDVESYVACVATSEMGAMAPIELLAAQTIVARCWALALVERKHITAGFDVCNDDCCQRYQGTTYVSEHSVRAARDTAGQVLAYEDSVIDARYSKNCGGLVEDYTAVWDGAAVPYLIPLWDSPDDAGEPHFGRFDTYFEFENAYCAPGRFEGADLRAMLGKVDVSGDYYRWRVDLPVDALLSNLHKHYGVEWASVEEVEIMSRGASARISALNVRGRGRDGGNSVCQVRGEYAIRRVFSESFLYSSAFQILNPTSFTKDGLIRLRGCGWGHGVGLCQMGALGMALAGRSVREIVQHYYPGAELTMLDGRK